MGQQQINLLGKGCDVEDGTVVSGPAERGDAVLDGQFYELKTEFTQALMGALIMKAGALRFDVKMVIELMFDIYYEEFNCDFETYCADKRKVLEILVSKSLARYVEICELYRCDCLSFEDWKVITDRVLQYPFQAAFLFRALVDNDERAMVVFSVIPEDQQEVLCRTARILTFLADEQREATWRGLDLEPIYESVMRMYHSTVSADSGLN